MLDAEVPAAGRKAAVGAVGAEGEDPRGGKSTLGVGGEGRKGRQVQEGFQGVVQRGAARTCKELQVVAGKALPGVAEGLELQEHLLQVV